MTGKKKPYVSPAIESERIDLPQAWACNANVPDFDVGGVVIITGPDLPGGVNENCI